MYKYNANSILLIRLAQMNLPKIYTQYDMNDRHPQICIPWMYMYVVWSVTRLVFCWPVLFIISVLLSQYNICIISNVSTSIYTT